MNSSSSVFDSNLARLITEPYLRDLRQYRIVALVGYVVLVYDYLLTVDNEIEYIWNAKPSTVNVIFLANRYGNLVLLTITTLQTAGSLRSTALSFCFSFTLVSSILTFLSFASIHVLVLLRVWAICGRRKAIFVILVASFGLYVLVSVAILLWGVISGGFYSYPLAPVVGTCEATIPSWAWTIFIPSMVLETGVFALTMYGLKGAFFHRMFYKSPMMQILIRDSAVYFLCSLFSSLLNIHYWIFYYDGPKSILANGFTLCLVSVVGQRLVMDLRILNRDHNSRTHGIGIGVLSDQSIGGGQLAYELNSIHITAAAAAVPEPTNVDEGVVSGTGDDFEGHRRDDG